jgi:hypothetical protein
VHGWESRRIRFNFVLRLDAGFLMKFQESTATAVKICLGRAVLNLHGRVGSDPTVGRCAFRSMARNLNLRAGRHKRML